MREKNNNPDAYHAHRIPWGECPCPLLPSADDSGLGKWLSRM